MAKPSQTQRVTQRDVAERAGVSTSIVSYVINHGPRSVSAETRARVLEAVEELGYRPNRHAQGLMRSKWQSDASLRDFGVVLGRSSGMFVRPYYGEVLAGIYDEADALHLRVRFIQSIDQLADPLLFNELIHSDEIAGLILFGVESGQGDAAVRLIDRMRERISNIVCVERQFGDLPSVTFDRANAAREAVNHLLQLGHRRIGFLGAVDDRLSGYRLALLDSGVEVDDTLVCSLPGGNTPAEGFQHVRCLMELEKPPTAIFCCSDEVAIGAINGLRAIGRTVPDDVALVSIDDIPFAQYITPSLTTIHVPKAQMGAYGVRMMREAALRPYHAPVSMLLPTTLIVRNSCGAHHMNPAASAPVTS